MKNFAIIALFLMVLFQGYIVQQEHNSVESLVWYTNTLRLDWEAERRSIYQLISMLPQDQVDQFYEDNRADLDHNNKFTNMLIQSHPELLKTPKQMDEKALDVVLASLWLMMHTMDKYKIHSRDNLTCPHMRELYDALDSMGYIELGKSLIQIKKELKEQFKEDLEATLIKSDTSIPIV